MSAPTSPAFALERLFTSPQVQPDWFAQSFLQAIPFAQIEQLLTQIKSAMGAFQAILDGNAPGKYQLQFERGTIPAQIALNSEGQIIGLFFQQIVPPLSPEAAVAQLKTFPGEVSLLICENGKPLASLNPDLPLAVGSAFKLAVLAALQAQIHSGQHSWTEIAALQAADLSLPSGILQDWYVGAQLTVESLATLMISQSDNTATDLLIRLLGRETVEQFSPRNQPFFTTRELFVLKARSNAGLLEQYRTGDLTTRHKILQQVANLPLPHRTDLDPCPSALDLEWYFTASELAGLMVTVADLPMLSVTSEAIDQNEWDHFAYKGGSEPGVLNLTTQVQRANKTYSVVLTWNDPTAPLDESKLLSLQQGILAGLREWS